MPMNGRRNGEPGELVQAFYGQDIRQRLVECGLTQRQQEVVELVIGGLSNREIGERLYY
jgi:ATP/maltotriose-dependent transcriptional regulator MalT